MAVPCFKILVLYLLCYVAAAGVVVVVFLPLYFFMAVTDLAACWAS